MWYVLYFKIYLKNLLQMYEYEFNFEFKNAFNSKNTPI